MRVARFVSILFFFLFASQAFPQHAPLCDVSCRPDPSSSTYSSGTFQARPLTQNVRGQGTPLARRVRGGHPHAPTLAGSQSSFYAIPILHLPGRNGLDLDLTLYYNSRVWTIDGPGGGKWSSRDRLDTTHVIVVNTPHYLIAYSPPESPEGSCHQIRVTVVRPNVFVRARSEYCNTEHSAADPLKGTKLGQQMESDLASARVGKFNLTVVGVVSYANTDAARVHIVLEFPAEPLKNAAKNKAEHAVGVLGMVYKKDGVVAARFSDRKSFEPPGTPYKNDMLVALPTRYETQLELPRGEYDLRTVLSDGTDFGVAQVPLSVNSYDEKQLALSEIAICGRLRQVSRELKKDTAKPRGNYVPLVSNGFEITPTANSRFKRGATLGVYFEVYEPQLAGPPPATVEARLRIVDLRTGVMKAVQPINTAPYVKVGSPIIPIGRQIEIKKLPKGSYRLEVQAADSTGKTTAWRAVNFTVE